MKELLVLRHAKAVEPEPSTADFDRPLTPRGVKDARAIGEIIDARDCAPERIVTSPAARALETATLCAKRIHRRHPVPIDEEPAIYEASPSDLLGIVQALPDDLDRVMLVGHNMGLEQFVNLLIGSNSPGPHSVHLKTCALAYLRLKCDTWADAGPSGARLDDLVTP